MSETTAISVLEKNKFEIVPLSEDLAEVLHDELDGETLQFDTFKIPGSGGLTFELPGESEDNPEIVKDVTGVILYHHKANAYWEGDFGGDGTSKPICSSNDGVTGFDSVEGCVRNCDTCPYNQFGSKGSGKACKNSVRVYFLVSGQQLPYVLPLPPTSMQPFKTYVAKSALKGRRSWQYLTRIGLKRIKGNVDYSVATFENLGNLTAEECASVKPMVDMVKALASSVSIIDDAPSAADAPSEDVSGNVPF